MQGIQTDRRNLIRRSKLYIPVNRDKFVSKAWTRGADCIILDLEDSIAPADKTSARKMVKDLIPIVNKGGAEVQVRINRKFEEEDLDTAVIAGLTSVMIPKCESADEIKHIDKLVTQLEKKRGFSEGKIQFDLIIETALGVINVESIVKASPRIVQICLGQTDISVDMGFRSISELNFEQYFYAQNKLLFAACAANVQACGLGAQNNVNFTSVSLSQEAMYKACQHAFWMGYMGTSLIHPVWVNAANDGFKPTQSDIDLARKVKVALDEAYAKGEGSVQVNGHMYDVANMKYVNYILERAEAIARREAEKAAAVKVAGGIS